MNLFNVDQTIISDASSSLQVLNRFITSVDHDVVSSVATLTLSGLVDQRDVFLKVKEQINKARAISYGFGAADNYIIYGKRGDVNVLVFLDSGVRKMRYEPDNDDEDENSARKYTIRVFSTYEASRSVCDEITKKFDEHRVASIRWWYIGEHGQPNDREVYLKPNNTILRAEFYPDLGCPYKFMDEYLSSKAAVLLLAGPPGTGKTTLLRHMITDRKLTTHVIYDEKLMTSDAIFQRFLFDPRSDMMVIEDADTILSARESDGNKMMARFLSISDGLIKLPNKKLVFTTNLSDFSKVDQALLRPGRCHAVVHTRPLNLAEAQAAAKAADLPVPVEKGEYTLAELFNSTPRPTLRTVGFGVRH